MSQAQLIEWLREEKLQPHPAPNLQGTKPPVMPFFLFVGVLFFLRVRCQKKTSGAGFVWVWFPGWLVGCPHVGVSLESGSTETKGAFFVPWSSEAWDGAMFG